MTKPKFWTSEKLLSMSALFVSLCTLGVFIYQTNLIRKQQYLSVYPYLSMSNAYTNSDKYQFILNNSGIGPAMIRDVKVKHKGLIHNMDLPDFILKYLNNNKIDSINMVYSNIPVGRLIPANEMVPMVAANGNKLSADFLHKFINSDDLELIIEYESIYGERWRISNEYTIPTRIK